MIHYERTMTQAELLAVAVLRGDQTAALALADEVQMTFKVPGKISLSMPVRELCEWPQRIRTILRQARIVTVGQLICQTSEDLLEFSNFGKTSLFFVQTELAKWGLKLADDRPMNSADSRQEQ